MLNKLNKMKKEEEKLRKELNREKTRLWKLKELLMKLPKKEETYYKSNMKLL